MLAAGAEKNARKRH